MARMNVKRTRAVIWALALAVGLPIFVAGCAGVAMADPPEAIVRDLATKRWQSLLAQDYEKAYLFLTPSYRQIHSAEYYRLQVSGAPVKWISAEVFRVECVSLKCNVRIKLESKPLVPFPMKGAVTGGIDEVWVYQDRQWYMLEAL